MLSSFPTKSDLCMVMEYVGGGDCRSLLSKRGCFSVPLARLYFTEAILAVEYLHSYGIVHRDLKPENLLITSTGHIKVTDFGLSKLGVMIPESNTYKELREDISREFPDSEYAGTPYYMAPEMILGESYGRPIDWWSMGIILYEFLVGTRPFDGDSTLGYFNLLNVVNGDIDWTCDPAPPPDAQNIITELLTKNPADRLGTEGAFQIKEHPFLRDLDFDNLLSQEPEYVPQLKSDMDTSVFLNHGGVDMDMISEDKEDNENSYFQNFTTSSQRLLKLCTSTTLNNDTKSPPESSPESTPEYMQECSPESTPQCLPDSTPDCSPESIPESTPECSAEGIQKCSPESTPECSPESTPECTPECSPESTPECTPECSPESTPECTPECSPESTPESAPECIPASSTNISKMQKESSPAPDRDDAITSLSSSSPLSEFPAQEERKSEKKEKGKKRRGNIFRRILSSCRRGLSRAARAFACCGCPCTDI
ncbi:microtubule-associated serine/threonine-protein kinase 3-like [Anomaloglossus baeobatrachus]|uniref:microtubule-associated serine/threonine-protein kinase 3-like n=1 Tax=Anomaloglossus baeobatrachus TaxID=238106 RepID=UPI003F50A224